MKASETAIIFIEFQNDFCKPGGRLYDLAKDELVRQHTIAHAVKLMEIARKHKVQIIQSPFIFDEKWADECCVAGVIAQAKEGGAFRAGEWGAELIEEMRIKDEFGDVRLEGKRALSGFTNTQLEKVLTQKKIKNVVVCGLLTNVCVEATARSAYDRGFNVTIIKDACASASQANQEYVETQVAPVLGQAITVDEFEKIIES